MISENNSDNSQAKELNKTDVSGGIGIKVDVNPYNDPRWSSRTGIHEEHKVEVLRVFLLGGNKVTFTKPEKDKCTSVVCFDKIPYGVQSRKIKNWNELPKQLPFNQEILDSYFFDGKAVVV